MRAERVGVYAPAAEAIRRERIQYAARLARVFDGYIRPHAGGSLLDVGGSRA
jgi:hypothetical protein